jgi:ABC-type enterochelin transport system ATPase subunit
MIGKEEINPGMLLSDVDWRVMSQCLKALQEHNNPHVLMAIRDLIGVGCYLHAATKRDEGWKVVATALKALEVSEVLRNKIDARLEGHEERFAELFEAHAEVLTLFRKLETK